jgi:hypothetical protein
LWPVVYLCTQAHDHFAYASAKAVYEYFLVLKDEKPKPASEDAS